MTDFDTAPVEDVLQETDDRSYDSGLQPVSVCVKDPVQTEELPSILGPCKNYIVNVTDKPVRILDRNPRRKRATIMVQNGDICVGGTPGEAGDSDTYVGAVISGGLAVPVHLEVQSELWARGVTVDLTGTAIALSDPTDAVLISVIEEFWTR
jgi:hypothetical protein